MKPQAILLFFSLVALTAFHEKGNFFSPSFKTINIGVHRMGLSSYATYCLEIVAENYNPNDKKDWLSLLEYVRGFNAKDKSTSGIFFTFYDRVVETSECSCNLKTNESDCAVVLSKYVIASGRISPLENDKRRVSVNPNYDYRINGQGFRSSVEIEGYCDGCSFYIK
ncbi:hypothetical protein [Runella limosa]|uniref:hypothetical protein n=1 Tax=Runella limosa TaxID=370978 RepID=UPI000490656D|nr:hypothetical protein [Runella limosa]